MMMHSHGLRPAAGIAASVHDNGVVFLHLARGYLFASNRVGAAMWQGLEQRIAPSKIAAQVSREYGIPYEVAYEHLQEFIADLARNQLLEPGRRS
jgi:hypothetical protein